MAGALLTAFGSPSSSGLGEGDRLLGQKPQNLLEEGGIAAFAVGSAHGDGDMFLQRHLHHAETQGAVRLAAEYGGEVPRPQLVERVGGLAQYGARGMNCPAEKLRSRLPRRHHRGACPAQAAK
ncbi:hypothetical protein B5F40_11045 [Gordonibacter sp. An230]|nr:hypothetical protein B5F40_11045 [Gordonibacter sp. An230]